MSKIENFNCDGLTPKQILQEARQEQELEDFKEKKINWLDDGFYDSWDKVKGHLKNLLGHGNEYDEDESVKWMFLAHSNDEIKGKPQLIESVQKRIPLIRQIIKNVKDKNTEEEIEISKYLVFDERYDKRYDGYQKDCFALDFWMYRVVQENGKDYYLLSQEQLPNEVCNFRGMAVEMDDFAEFSRSMKIKSLSRMFFLKEFVTDVKILTPEQLIIYTKERGITEEDWFKFLSYHPKFKSYNNFVNESKYLRSAQLLSGEVDDYPLHLGVLGSAGTKKSKGYMETIAYKFDDHPVIIEGATSRIKGLSPSFVSKPANIGYLAKCNRMGFVDEIGKMVNHELQKHQNMTSKVLGEINFLLDHSERRNNSGNDNDVDVKATAKFIFVTNPVIDRTTIYAHVGVIDDTTMSRIFWWVQDENEQKFALSPESITRVSFPPTPAQAQDRINSEKYIKKYIGLDTLRGKYNNNIYNIVYTKINNRAEFLTLFDTCNSFISDMDDSEVNKLVSTTTMLAREPMKSSVWLPRAEHHVRLLIDGLVKHRCLFKDYDPLFLAKKEDYDLAECILVRMVKGWDTDLSPKEMG
jgi:hypothetical protein